MLIQNCSCSNYLIYITVKSGEHLPPECLIKRDSDGGIIYNINVFFMQKRERERGGEGGGKEEGG